MEMAESEGFKVQVTNLTKYDLYTADEVFLCSTAGGIFPVVEIDGRRISDGKVGPHSRELIQSYNRLLKEGKYGTRVNYV
jgi:branched-chain amino acid aminotransferase